MRRQGERCFSVRALGETQTQNMMHNVEATGPPTFAAKPPPAVVGPCWPTCYASPAFDGST
jgi:hypothetical protein